MATIRQIKDKQNSIKSINKTTMAMQLVATAKSQKAIKEWRIYKEYSRKINKIVHEISKELTKPDSYKGTYWILMLSDMGLAGGYNINLIRELNNSIKENDKLIIIGKKGKNIIKKFNEGKNISVVEFNDEEELNEIILTIKKSYYEDNLRVKTIHTQFINQMNINVISGQIFPIEFEEGDIETNTSSVVEFEPSKEELMLEISDLYIQSFLIGIYKESQASEHTSRRIAMEAASKNGEELIEKLNIEYNRARQAKITQEISEIIAGAESVK